MVNIKIKPNCIEFDFSSKKLLLFRFRELLCKNEVWCFVGDYLKILQLFQTWVIGIILLGSVSLNSALKMQKSVKIIYEKTHYSEILDFYP